MPKPSIDLSNISTADLEKALAERKRQEELAAMPKLIANPDWTPVIAMVTGSMREMIDQKRSYFSDDFDHYVAEKVLKTIYGQNFYDWYNLRGKKLERQR